MFYLYIFINEGNELFSYLSSLPNITLHKHVIYEQSKPVLYNARFI